MPVTTKVLLVPSTDQTEVLRITGTDLGGKLFVKTQTGKT